jgi:DNA-binding protein HU-beta
MTKAELIEKMAMDAGISKVAAGAALDSFVDGVTSALKKKEGKVTLVGFGTFQKVRRKARKGRNPQTGEEIKIKATNVVKFKPGKKTQRFSLIHTGVVCGRLPALPQTALRFFQALPPPRPFPPARREVCALLLPAAARSVCGPAAI